MPIEANGQVVNANDQAVNDSQLINLVEQEKVELGALDNACAKLKTSVGDIELAIIQLQTQKMSIANEYMAMQMSFRRKAEEIANAHGIAINDPSKGRWNLDTTTMTFHRVG